MIPIRTERLILRNWEERDRSLFHLINSDKQVMEFFPFRRDRAQSDAKMDELRAWIDSHGYGFAPVEVAATGECIGFVGLYDADYLPALPKGSVEIGWRLAPEFMARLRLRDAWSGRNRFLRRTREPPLDCCHGTYRHDGRPVARF
jgi:RimJ/RimL family protein N-acetyltransferase